MSWCHCSIVIALWHYCHRVIAVSIHSASTPSSLHCRVIARDRVTLIALSHYRHRIVLSPLHPNQTSIVQWCDREQYGFKHITYIIDTNRKILPPGTEKHISPSIYSCSLFGKAVSRRSVNLNDPRSKYSVDCNLSFWHLLHRSLLNKFS